MIAILGGGITALSAAYELQKNNIDFILLEKESTLGGKIQSIQKEGYTCELGPNTVLINNLEIKELIQDLGLNQELIFPEPLAVKNRLVLKNGTLEAIPTSLKSAIRSKLIGFNTLLNIILERFRKKGQSEKEESLADFIKRRFGKQIYEDIVTPFVTGIYAGDPEKMSSDYVLSMLKEAEQKHGSVLKGMMKIMKDKKAQTKKEGLPKQKIFTFKNGLQTLVHKIQEKIEARVMLNAQVSSIRKDGNQYVVSYEQNGTTNELQVNGIISTIPAPALSKLYIHSNLDFSSALNNIHSVAAVVVHLGYEKKKVGFDQNAFGILSKANEKVPFLGILFNSRFFPHTAPPEKDLLTIICGGYKNPELIHQSDDEIVEEIKRAIQPLLGIQEEPNFVHIKKWEKGIPQYELGYAQTENSIMQFENEHAYFFIGGNFYKGISVSDCVANGKKLATNFS